MKQFGMRKQAVKREVDKWAPDHGSPARARAKHANLSLVKTRMRMMNIRTNGRTNAAPAAHVDVELRGLRTPSTNLSAR